MTSDLTPDEIYDNEIAALDALDPTTRPSGDASHFRRIMAARHKAAEVEVELQAAVAAARAAGDSWTIIGAALGTSPQTAFQRFGPS